MVDFAKNNINQIYYYFGNSTLPYYKFYGQDSMAETKTTRINLWVLPLWVQLCNFNSHYDDDGDDD